MADHERARRGPRPPARRLGWLASGLAVVLLLAVGGPLAYLHLFPGLPVGGVVLDVASGEPVPGARLAPGDATTDLAGRFLLPAIKPTDTIDVQADGYQPASVRPGLARSLRIALEPQAVEVVVVDAETDAPLPDAELQAEGVGPEPIGPGRFRLRPARAGRPLIASAPGFEPTRTVYAGGDELKLALRPRVVGRVAGPDGRPVLGARLFLNGAELPLERDGTYRLSGRPRGDRLVALAPGYRRAARALGPADSLDVTLEPFVARGLYLTFFGVGNAELRGRVLQLIEQEGLNSVVIDVKGDRGLIAYASRVPLAARIGANASPTIPDAPALLADLKRRGIYTIARIVVFKDDKLARNGAAAGLDVAVKDARTGQPWIDGEGLGWTDPFRPEVWEYNVALAREAAELGFEEVQFDYIRFPTDPGVGTDVGAARYAQPSTEAGRVVAIAGFLDRARAALHPLGTYLSVDTFGYTCFAADDLGIGQHLETIAERVDYLSPMVYPSTYHAGLPGGLVYPTVVSRPYEVVFASLRRARERIGARPAVLRPWLQYFDDYPWATGFRYDAPQISAQRQAAADAGAQGWLFWDPTNRYERGGLR